MTDIVCQRLHFDEKSLRFKILDDLLARVEPVQTLIYTACGGDLRVFSDHADLCKIVALAHIKVG